MGELRKKPKPFSAMKKVLYGGVQSRRVMVFASLVLVILGCLALYSAMQNEDWTQDEPSQRKVFFLASVLLISSIALCYYALHGEMEENEMIEAEHLIEIKFDDYKTIKTSQPRNPENSRLTPSSGMQDKYLKLLQPNEYQCASAVNNSICQAKCNNHLVRNGQLTNIQGDVITDNISEIGKPGYQNESDVKEETTLDNIEKRNKAIIAELLPLLPLELSENEISNLNIPLTFWEALGKPIEYQIPRDQLYPDLANPFNSVNKHSDAG